MKIFLRTLAALVALYGPVGFTFLWSTAGPPPLALFPFIVMSIVFNCVIAVVGWRDSHEATYKIPSEIHESKVRPGEWPCTRCGCGSVAHQGADHQFEC